MILDNKKNIQQFLFELRRYLPFYGFSQSVIKLIFLKHLLNYSDDTEPEILKLILEYQKMFIEKKFDYLVINNIIQKIEEKYFVDNSFINYSINNFLKENVKNENKIIDIVSSFEIPENTKVMVELIEEILDFNEGKDVSKTSNYSTNKSLVELVNRILKVNNTDVYMDSFCGFYRSALKLNASMYKGYEIDEEVLAIAQIIFILTNKKKFQLENKDFYTSVDANIADKIYTNGPFNTRVNGLVNRKSDYYNINLTLNALKENGLAVVTTVGGLLYRTDYKNLREDVTKNNLKAIISLPALYSNTSIDTILLVLEKHKTDQNIVFVDATDKKYYKTDKRTNVLTQTAIDKIIEALECKNIESFSTVVNVNAILSTPNILWQPSIYIKKISSNVNRSLHEIDNELDNLYSKLSNLFNEK